MPAAVGSVRAAPALSPAQADVGMFAIFASLALVAAAVVTASLRGWFDDPRGVGGGGGGGGVGGYTEVEEEAVDAGARGGGDHELEYLGEKELGLSEVTVTTTG